MTVPVTTAASGIVLEGPIAELRERQIRLMYELAERVGKTGEAGVADKKRLIDSANDLREMFLLVVVIGEFNSGKSTFVNALLGDAVLPMDIKPSTDAIELIRFGVVASRIPDIREDGVREWKHPHTGAPGIVIVDTPGTGSVFARHEQIAKSFLHRSDLVIFVINAKRAFAETERVYLELAKSYGKKIIIVINQIDLLEAKEQNDVRNFVAQQVRDLLDLRPAIFMVSAKKALQGDKTGGLLAGLLGGKEDWGLNAVRSYLRETFAQVPPAKQKLLTQLELARKIADKYRGEVNSKLALIGADTNAAEDLQHEIEQQATNLDKQLDSTLKEIKAIFDAVRLRGERFIDKHIRIVRAAMRGFDKEALQKEFDTDVIGDTISRLTTTREFYVNALVDSGRAYWRDVIARLNRMEALLRAESGSMDAAAYADQRTALQSALSLADVEMKAYTNEQVIDNIEKGFETNISYFSYGVVGSIGGLLALLLGIATPGPIAAHALAVLGVALGAPIALVGGGIAIWAWRSAVNKARTQMNTKIGELETTFKDAIVKVTNSERSRLLQYGKQILTPVFSQLQTLAQRYRAEQADMAAFTEQANTLEKEINTITVTTKA